MVAVHLARRSHVISRPTILAVLALPAGAIGYIVTTNILSSLGLRQDAEDVLLLIVPLFVAGLCMAPFVLPLFDRMAKRDLAALRARQDAEAAGHANDDKPND
jgi:hypothetical protein